MTEKIIAKYVCGYCGSEFDHDDAGLKLCAQCERSHKMPVSCSESRIWDKPRMCPTDDDNGQDMAIPNYPRYITVKMNDDAEVFYTRGVVGKAPWNE